MLEDPWEKLRKSKLISNGYDQKHLHSMHSYMYRKKSILHFLVNVKSLVCIQLNMWEYVAIYTISSHH